MDKKIAIGLIRHILNDTNEEIKRLVEIKVTIKSSPLSPTYSEELDKISKVINWMTVSGAFQKDPSINSVDIAKHSNNLFTGHLTRSDYEALSKINRRKMIRENRLNSIKAIVNLNLALSIIEDFVNDVYDVLAQAFPNHQSNPTYKQLRWYNGIGTFFEQTDLKFLNSFNIILSTNPELKLTGNFFKELRNIHEHKSGKISSKLIEHYSNLGEETKRGLQPIEINESQKNTYLNLNDELIDRLNHFTATYINSFYEPLRKALNK